MKYLKMSKTIFSVLFFLILFGYQTNAKVIVNNSTKISTNSTSNIKVEFKTKNLNLAVNKSMMMKPAITAGKNSYKKVLWYSSDPSVLTIDQSGNAKGVKSGSSFVIATTNVGADIGIVEVNVSNGGKASTQKLDKVAKLKYALTAHGNKYDGIYSGEVKKGVPQGEGAFMRIGNERNEIFSYYGHWENGKMSGQGMNIFQDGSKLIGSFKDNEPNGQCLEFYPNGNVMYSGNYLNGSRNGQGEYTWEDGTKFIGQLINSKMVNGKFVLNPNDNIAKENNISSFNSNDIKSLTQNNNDLKSNMKDFLISKTTDYMKESIKTKYLNTGMLLYQDVTGDGDLETKAVSTTVDYLMPPWVTLVAGDAPRNVSIDIGKSLVYTTEDMGKDALSSIPEFAKDIMDVGGNNISSLSDTAKSMLKDGIDKLKKSGKALLDSGKDAAKDTIDGMMNSIFH